MSLGEPIANGRTAEVYLWGDGWVLRLFHEWFPEDGVQYEAKLARAVHGAGLPIPGVGDLVEVNGRPGLVYERVDGPTMADQVSAKPWTLLKSARLVAEVHAKIHTAKVAVELPSQRQRLEDKLHRAKGLSTGLREAALCALEGMPIGALVCHGDFHPENVIAAPQGPVIIDWIDATLGNPLADVARSSVILLGRRASGRSSWLLTMLMGWYHSVYLKCCFELRPGGEVERVSWFPIAAAARLDEGIGEIEDWLLVQAQTGLG